MWVGLRLGSELKVLCVFDIGGCVFELVLCDGVGCLLLRVCWKK